MLQSRLRPTCMWNGLGAMAIALPMLLSTQAAAADYVLVFAGQSNMVGIGTQNNPPPSGDQAPIANVKGFYTNSYCDGVGSAWDTGRTAPERFGERTYVEYRTVPTQNFANAPRWATVSYATSAGQRTVGGTWQDYQWWRSTWTGKDPFTGADYVYQKTQGYNTQAGGEFWHIGLNPGDPFANAWDYRNGPNFGSPTTRFRINVQAFGPELGVAKAISIARATDRFWIVKYAYGGTALAKNGAFDWDPTSSGELYQGLTEWVAAARAALPGAAAGAPVAGFFWMQGEQDCTNATWAANYQTNLTTFISSIRTDFGAPQLPVVLGKVRSDCPGSPSVVRAAQAAVDTADTRVVAVETDGLTLQNPEWENSGGLGSQVAGVYHYDTTSVLALGASMGAAWLTLAPATPTNAAPIVTGNPDQTVTWPAAATLAPVVTDPDSDPLTYAWSVVSGPVGADVTWANASGAGIQATFSAQGAYTLRLTVDDGNGHVVTDDVQVTVATARQRLFIFAGDQNMNSEGAIATLATEDTTALPGVLGYYWREPTSSFTGNSPWVPATAAWESYVPWKAPATAGEYVGLNPGDGWSTIDQSTKRHFGPDFTTARVIQQALTQPIRVVKYATSYPNSLITGWMANADWDAAGWASTVSTGPHYQALRSWVQQAMAAQNVELAGIFWVHGAVDDGVVSKQKYARALLSLIGQFRSDFGQNVPVIMPYFRNGTQIRQAQFEVATGAVDGSSAVPVHLATINAGGLTSPYSSSDTKDYVGTPLGNAWLGLTDPLAPTVSAGANVSLTLPATATMAATASDVADVLTYFWSQVSGPTPVTFSDRFQLNPIVTCASAGTYTLRLTVSDGQGNVVTSDVVITAADPVGGTTAGGTTAGGTTAGGTTAGGTTAGGTTAGGTTAGGTTAGGTTAGGTTAGGTTAGGTTAGGTTAGGTTAGSATAGGTTAGSATGATATTGTGSATATAGGTGVVIENSGDAGGGCGTGAAVALFLGMLGFLTRGRRNP